MSDPYATGAHAVLDSGLGYPIPSMFPYEKHPPMPGWTGREGMVPDEEQIERWRITHPDSNLLIRLAPDVIGIDIDDYDEKTGAATLKVIEEQHGPFPPTYSTSARDDVVSGIYYLRLRQWMDSGKMRDPGQHIEVIRYEHRYAVAPPSWHPGARARYRWSWGKLPSVGDLAWLPVDWYVHLTRGCDCFEVERAERRRLMRRLNNRPSGEAGARAARADLDQAAEALRLAADGGRNNMLSSMAGRFLLYDVVLNQHLPADEVIFSLMAAATTAGLPEREAKRTIQSAMEWAVREGDSR